MSETPPQKAKGRPVKVRVFGQAMRDARGALSLGQVRIKTGASTSYVHQLEKGTVEAPDPVLLSKLAEVYGVSFVGLVELLRWNRENPGATEAPSVVPEVEGMRVTGTEELLVRTVRRMRPASASQLWEYIEFLQNRAGGANTSDATFRRRKKGAR